MKTLVATIHSGMADRVRALLAFKRLADETKREFLFLWTVNDHCGAQFEDVFSTVSPMVTPTDPWPGEKWYSFDDAPWREVEAFVKRFDGDEVLKVQSFAPGADQTYDDFGTFINFNAEIQETADEFVSGWISHAVLPTVGCHVRARDKQTEGVTPPLKMFTDVLDAVAEGHQIFLASDSLDVRRELESRYGKRLLEIQYKSLNCAERQGCIDAAIELAILRQCKSLVLSPYSGFSRMAMKSDTLRKVGYAINK